MNTKTFADWDFDQHDPGATWTKLVSAALTMWFLTVFQLYFSTLYFTAVLFNCISQPYFTTVLFNCISQPHFLLYLSLVFPNCIPKQTVIKMILMQAGELAVNGLDNDALSRTALIFQSCIQGSFQAAKTPPAQKKPHNINQRITIRIKT